MKLCDKCKVPVEINFLPMHKWFDCDDTQAKPFYKEKPKHFIWSTLITTMKTVPTDEFEKALREDAIKNN